MRSAVKIGFTPALSGALGHNILDKCPHEELKAKLKALYEEWEVVTQRATAFC